MPGIQQVVSMIARDERRHMAWGTFTCRRHIAADDSNWQVVQDTLDELLQPALSIIDVTFDEYEERGKSFPFGITRDELSNFATNQFSRRIEVIEAARGKSVESIEGTNAEEELELQLEADDLGSDAEAVSA